VMAHLPLALLDHPRDGLVICFGMGTTFRSMVSWGVDTTVVDLTQSVVDSFGFFHADAGAVVMKPNVHIVVDDGRRFLLRTKQMFDVIVIDPPPPIEAAGSSLLYSTGFYEAAKRRLRFGGILQQWSPSGEQRTDEAITRSLQQAFPYVAAYLSIEDLGLAFPGLDATDSRNDRAGVRGASAAWGTAGSGRMGPRQHTRGNGRNDFRAARADQQDRSNSSHGSADYG
jgi:spermidine synthase